MRILSIFLMLLTGLATGFFGGLYLFDPSRSFWLSGGGVDYYYGGGAALDPEISFDDGWGFYDDGRTGLSRDGGVITFALHGQLKGPLTFTLSAGSGHLPSSGKKQIDVLANGSKIGVVSFYPQQMEVVDKKFLVPEKLASQSGHLRISFRSRPAPRNGERIISVNRLALQDTAHLVDNIERRGFVDSCSLREVSGWAAAGDHGAVVRIRVNGRPVALIKEHFDRPDLPKHGLPLRAGFRYRFARPLSKGDRVEVLFVNGQSLSGKKCQF